MRCKTCKRTFRNPGKYHHWEHGQCEDCHYLRPTTKPRLFQGSRVRGENGKAGINKFICSSTKSKAKDIAWELLTMNKKNGF